MPCLLSLLPPPRAKNITNKPRINEDPKDAMLREFQEEILRLKAALAVSGWSRHVKEEVSQFYSACSEFCEVYDAFSDFTDGFYNVMTLWCWFSPMSLVWLPKGCQAFLS